MIYLLSCVFIGCILVNIDWIKFQQDGLIVSQSGILQRSGVMRALLKPLATSQHWYRGVWRVLSVPRGVSLPKSRCKVSSLNGYARWDPLEECCYLSRVTVDNSLCRFWASFLKVLLLFLPIMRLIPLVKPKHVVRPTSCKVQFLASARLGVIKNIIFSRHAVNSATIFHLKIECKITENRGVFFSAIWNLPFLFSLIST